MAIEIYAVKPEGVELIAVAPLDQHNSVILWCAEKNKEAEEAGVIRRFKYSVGCVEIWNTVS